MSPWLAGEELSPKPAGLLLEDRTGEIIDVGLLTSLLKMTLWSRMKTGKRLM